jgi:HD-GYP domain-containing protein (c-di-GMP phosphodiesterase class II)
LRFTSQPWRRIGVVTDVHGTPLSDQDVLLAALEARDPGTARHTAHVAELAERVAIRLGLSDDGVEEVAQVAALHDVGKLATPDSILLKSGPLDEAERTIMEAHTIVGGDVLARIPSLAHLERAVRATHERWDGTGYPDGLCGATIPLASRIVFVCDAYDAMTSVRPYRAVVMDNDAAIAELERCAGTQFCPRSAEALIAVVEFERETELSVGR